MGGSRIFFRRGCTCLLLYFNTNTPHFFFFCRIPVVLENYRSSQRRGGNAHPLQPPPRSAPVNTLLICFSFSFIQDIDECTANIHRCNLNASCTNNLGSFTCNCFPGFSGDGQTCSGNDISGL